VDCPNPPTTIEDVRVTQVAAPATLDVGSTTIYTVNYCNDGTAVFSDGGMSYSYDTAKLSFVNVNGQLPSPNYSVNNGVIYFSDMSDINPGVCKSFNLYFMAISQGVANNEVAIGRDF
jgi:hypothetical protein